MTRKECRELANKIAKEEKIIKYTHDEDAIKDAQERIAKLIFSIENLSLEDMHIVDEMVQEILS